MGVCKMIFKWCMCVLVAQSYRTLCDPMDYNPPGSSVHGISQARNWSGLPFPSARDLPGPGMEPMSPAVQADSLPLSHLGRLFSKGRDYTFQDPG